MMKRTPRIIIIILTAAAVMLLLLLPGCTDSPPLSSADELNLHRWSIFSDTDNISGILFFKNNSLTLEAELNGEKTSIKGECFIDNEHITVISDDYGTVVFDYKLNDDKLILEYYKKNITFIKDGQNIDE